MNANAPIQNGSPVALRSPVIEQFRSGGCLAYLVFDPDSAEAAVIDPCADGVDAILRRIEEARLRLRWAIDTHTHADHLSGVARLARETDAVPVMSERSETAVAKRRVADGDALPLGASALEVLATPGHTPDSIAIRAGGAVFTGDTLLLGGTGRTDFVGGDPGALFDSLETRLRSLPGSTVVYPGHEYRGRTHSTIAAEQRTNEPFRDRDRESFVRRYLGAPPPEPAQMRFILEANRTGAAARSGRSDAASVHERIGRGEPVLLLDVRSRGEFAHARIAGSTNVPLEEIASASAALPADRPVVIVCQSGARSAMALPALAGRDASVLEGGLAAWTKAGLPVEGGGPWPMERQVRFAAGGLVLIGAALSIWVHVGFAAIPLFVGAGLVFSAVTGTCGMASVLARLPWNRRIAVAGPHAASGAPGGGCGTDPAGGGSCAA